MMLKRKEKSKSQENNTTFDQRTTPKDIDRHSESQNNRVHKNAFIHYSVHAHTPRPFDSTYSSKNDSNSQELLYRISSRGWMFYDRVIWDHVAFRPSCAIAWVSS